MRICVTGANGFVGSNLCKTLIDQGHEVVGLIRSTSDRRFIRDLPALAISVGDVTDESSLQRAFAGAAVVYHAAAHTSDWGDSKTFRAVNIDGVRKVMECACASGVKRVVHISSVSVYGFPNKTDIDEHEPWICRADDPYVTSKQHGERIALGFNGEALAVTALRPGGLYGLNDRTTSLKLFAQIARRRFAYVDGGARLMGPLFVGNFVQAAVAAADHPLAPGQAYNLVDDGRTTWRQYVEWICRYLPCEPPRISIASWMAWPAACAIEAAAKALGSRQAPLITKYRVRAVMGDHHYSSAKAKRELGYKPAIATEAGIRLTVDWYQDQIAKLQQGAAD